MAMECLMYKRPHHQKVAIILAAMNADFLRDTKCYFGGGTAIALRLNEYRESVDIDFLCADQPGWRKIRESVFDNGLNDFFVSKIEVLREVRTTQDKIHTVLMVENTPIKFEIIREARIDLEGQNLRDIPVPCLTRNDLFAEKLLANADRYNDKSNMSRDIIDLMIMERDWGPIPKIALEKAIGSYGSAITSALEKAKHLLRTDSQHLKNCLENMGISDDIGNYLRQSLTLSYRKLK